LRPHMRTAVNTTWTSRGIAAVIALACAAPLVVACTLVPSATGMDTHRQLGLPACGWPTAFGVPCFSCGMTTSFALAVRGRLLAALYAQPAGFVLVCAAALGVVVAAWVAISGRSVHRFLQPLATGRLAIVACVVILAGWGWKLAVMKGLFA